MRRTAANTRLANADGWLAPAEDDADRGIETAQIVFPEGRGRARRFVAQRVGYAGPAADAGDAHVAGQPPLRAALQVEAREHRRHVLARRREVRCLGQAVP